MYAHIALAWIHDLTTTTTKQACGQLRKVNNETGEASYCCLGRLAHLYNKMNPTKEQITGKEFEEPTISKQVQDWAGLKTRIGGYCDNTRHTALSENNDARRHSFHQIAQTIAQHWEEL